MISCVLGFMELHLGAVQVESHKLGESDYAKGVAYISAFAYTHTYRHTHTHTPATTTCALSIHIFTTDDELCVGNDIFAARFLKRALKSCNECCWDISTKLFVNVGEWE